MARAGGPVLDLSVGREAEPLLRAFVCLLLGHGWNLEFSGIQHFTAGQWSRKGGLIRGLIAMRLQLKASGNSAHASFLAMTCASRSFSIQYELHFSHS